MSKLVVVNSGSDGNAYAIECGEEILLIEAGMSYSKDILPVINWKGGKVVGCIVSHRQCHKDHAKFIPELIYRAVPVYANEEVREQCKGVNLLMLNEKRSIGGFKVQCIDVPHNAKCYSFIIDCPDGYRILFITDCANFKYRIKGVNGLFVEMNYSSKVIENNVIEHNQWAQSASQNHLSLEQAIEVIKRHKTNDLKHVVGVHLSNSNSDEAFFATRVFEETGIRTLFAVKGLVLNLEKEDF